MADIVVADQYDSRQNLDTQSIHIVTVLPISHGTSKKYQALLIMAKSSVNATLNYATLRMAVHSAPTNHESCNFMTTYIRADA